MTEIENFLKSEYAQANVEDLKILHKLVLERKPLTIFEIGCGASTATISYAIKENLAEILKDVKEDSAINPIQFISIDIDKNRIDDLTLKLEKHKINYVKLIHQNSLDYMPPNLPKNSLDFIFLDSSHELHTTLLELLFLIFALKKDGILVIHDTHMPPVRDAIYLILDLIKTLDFYEYNTHHGLGVIKKK